MSLWLEGIDSTSTVHVQSLAVMDYYASSNNIPLVHVVQPFQLSRGQMIFSLSMTLTGYRHLNPLPLSVNFRCTDLNEYQIRRSIFI